MTKKTRTAFVCNECGADSPRWVGQCNGCGAWNSLKEIRLTNATQRYVQNYSYAGAVSSVQTLASIPLSDNARLATGLTELDRVLGGGIVRGSVILIGGAPGAGKSTLLLQVIAQLASQTCAVLYVSGEESLQQIAERAQRLTLPVADIKLLAETSVQQLCTAIEQVQPQVVIIDSIQVMYTEGIESAPGSVTQVRESASYLTQYAKRQHIAMFMVGHVTKDQALAGPMTLSHIVDAQLVLTVAEDARFRMLRADKNRFGSVGELGFFTMEATGLKEIKNPSAMLLARSPEPTPGSAVTVLWEGTRPLLVEIQALVIGSQYGNPRRLAVGLDQNRLAMLLAVLARHGGISTTSDEIYANVVGGLKVSETSSDLAIVVSIVSSLKNRAIPHDVCFFGELGLNGELRPVANGQTRLIEAAKHGFKRAIIPKANQPKAPLAQLCTLAVGNIAQALQLLADL